MTAANRPSVAGPRRRPPSPPRIGRRGSGGTAADPVRGRAAPVKPPRAPRRRPTPGATGPRLTRRAWILLAATVAVVAAIVIGAVNGKNTGSSPTVSTGSASTPSSVNVPAPAGGSSTAPAAGGGSSTAPAAPTHHAQHRRATHRKQTARHTATRRSAGRAGAKRTPAHHKAGATGSRAGARARHSAATAKRSQTKHVRHRRRTSKQPAR